MSGGAGDSGEKTHEATPQKLEKARKKGDIAKSADLSVAAAYLGLLVAFLAFGAAIIPRAAAGLAVFLSMPDRLEGQILGPGGLAVSGGILLRTIAPLAPIFIVPLALVLASLVGQRGFVVAPDKLIPKLSRISPISGAKNKFGLSGLVEFFKTFIKMLVVAVVVGFYLNGHFGAIIGLSRAAPASLVQTIFQVLVDLLTLITVFAVLVGVADLVWQRFDHARKQRMSLQEMKDEHKESEGDPHTKSQRRQKGRDIATNRMMQDVPKADVVVVNPTHYAVALQWSRKPGSAPKCVAKGEDEVAARIREVASVSGVPIHSDPPTARAIYASVKIGQEIRPEHYQAIAAALRFAEIMRKKARERGLS